MSESVVDPIQYAWARCNRGVSFPIALRMRNLSGSPLATSLSNAWRASTAPLSAEEAAIRALTVHRWLAVDPALRKKTTP